MVSVAAGDTVQRGSLNSTLFAELVIGAWTVGRRFVTHTVTASPTGGRASPLSDTDGVGRATAACDGTPISATRRALSRLVAVDHVFNLA